jgi:nucleotide-binding universal stress UspA family protein
VSAFEHILVPTDFSEPSERAQSIAIDLARAFGAKLTLLHVWSMLYARYGEGMTWPVAAMEHAAQKALEGARARAAELYAQTDAVLRSGGELEEILDVVAAQKIDLVVMGTHGRRGLPRLLVGSVAEKVVRMSPVPVLTVGVTPGLRAKAHVEGVAP